MSLRRSVVLSVVPEGRTQARTARAYGVSKATVSLWVTRYRTEGDAALEPRPRRPRTSPAKVSDEVAELVVNLRAELFSQGLDAGPHTICWHLQQRHGIAVSPSTIWRLLTAAGLVEPSPKKRPRSSCVRFQADLPNQMRQSDFCHRTLSDGSTTEIITWLDDHSRYALSVTAHRRTTGPIVVETFDKTAEQHGFPASTPTDNAMACTTRLSGGRGGRNAFEARLAASGIEQKNSAPNHPTTCGKAERFQQTPKKWPAAQPAADTIDALQAQLDEFTATYNHNRPHRALGRPTPAAAYRRLPKAEPGQTGDTTHLRVRKDTVDKSGTVTLRHNGKLHHIGIGRAHKHTPATLLIADTHIRVIDHTTGELLHRLIPNPERDYQPRHKT